MKKILYISDYRLDQYNSVRDILYNLITQEAMAGYEQVIVEKNGEMHNGITLDYYEGFKVYSDARRKASDYLRNKDINIRKKISYSYHKVLHKAATTLGLSRIYNPYGNIEYINAILTEEKPDLVVFLIYTPVKRYARLCKRKNIPYISVLYDTYIGRPGIDVEKAQRCERFVIEKAKGYHVPSFFYDLYFKTYDCGRIFSLNLPLLIEEEQVINAYKNTAVNIDFSYFGQIQSFRNGDKIKSILKKLNIKLDVFTTEQYKSSATFQVHPAVTKDELYLIVAGSKFLVAIDNSFPYQDYLPSKAYLHVSFTKPIIAFGDNESSALKTFFKDYPWFYYQHINASTDGLIKFLGEMTQNNFDKDCYSMFLDYLPKQALEPLVQNIKEVLD